MKLWVAVGLVFGVLGATIVAWRWLGAPEPPPGSASPRTAIVGATLIDGTGRPPIADGVVLIEGARLARVGTRDEVAIPPQATRIDATGQYVIPGLADMHNHLRSGTSSAWQPPAENLRFLLAWGITLTFVPALPMTSVEDLHGIRNGPAGPYGHAFTTGPIFTPAAAAGNPGGDLAPQSEAEARLAVRDLRAKGVDAIKIFHDDMSWIVRTPRPTFSGEIVAAIIDEAHRAGLKVYVHAPIRRFAAEALRAGADGLLHGIISEAVDDDFLALLRRNHAVYVATLSLFESAADLEQWVRREQAFDSRGVIPRSAYEAVLAPQSLADAAARWDNAAYTAERLPIARENLRRAFVAGVPIVAGTDTGLRGVVLGIASHLELVLHVEAGVPASEVLRAATLNAARMVGREHDLGSLEPGKLADLLILDADPLADIGNTRALSRIVKGGTLYDPVALWRSMGGMKGR